MAVVTDLLKIIATIVLGLSSWTLLSLLKNYKTARQIGLPLITSPVTPLNPFWILTWQLFPPILFLRYLPFGLGTWARCTYMGWNFDDQHALHDDFDDIFTIVTPGCNEIVIADPEAVVNVFSRRKDHIKPAIVTVSTKRKVSSRKSLKQSNRVPQRLRSESNHLLGIAPGRNSRRCSLWLLWRRFSRGTM